MAEQMFPPLVSKNGLGGGSLSNSSAMFFQPELIEFAPELPDVFDLMSIGVSRLDIADMICRTSLDDVERLPAIHPSVMSSRGEQVTRYITFVSSPPIETRAPKDRPRLEKKKNILGPEDCFRCQLKTEHSACERHKFVRVGGGFRHSFSYIKQILDVIEDKSRQQAAETAKRLARVREEHEHKAFLRATQQKRKVKTYVRTKSGKLIKQYVFVTEKEYQEMKVDDVAARHILGLSTDEKLEDFTSTRKKYVVNEDGEYVEVHKIREDSAYQESLESVNRGQDGGKASRRHRHRRQRGKGGNYSDDDLSIESGVGGSVEGGKCRSRRRRRRHRRGRSSYSSSASEESYINADGKKHVKSRRRRHRSREGDRRRRRHRSYSTSGDSGSDDADEEGKSRRHRRHRDKHGRRRRKSYYLSDGSDEDGSRGGHRGHGKRRHRLHRRGRSYSDDSFSSDDSRRRQRRRRRRGRRQSGSQGSCSGDYSDGTEGSPRRRRRHHHRRYSDDSESYSDYSGNSDDSTTVSSSGVDDSYSSISSSDTSTTYNTSSSSAVSIASSVSSVNSSDISSIEGDYTEDELQRLKQEKKEKTKKQKQQAKQKTKENKRKETREEKRESKRTEREKVKEKKKKRKDEKKRERRRNKVKMSPVSSVSDVSSVNSDDISDVDSNLGEEDRRILIEEKKLKKKEAKKANKFDQKVEKKKEEWRSKKKEKEKRRRVIELQKELERMSSASSVESVNSDDLSSIDSNLSDGEKQRIKEKKKAERQLTKNIIKAKSRLKEKRKKEGKVSDHEDDVTIDEIGDEEIKAAIKKIKRGKKVKGGKGGIDGDDSDDRYGNYAYGNRTDKASKNKKENEKLLAKNDMLELRAPDGTKVRVSIPKSMRIGGKFVGKIRLKVDGTVAADDDEDAESVIIDEDGNLVSQPTMLINPKTIVLDNETWDGFQPTPPPPKTPTDGGRVQFTGIKRVLHAFRKNGEVLQKHLDVVLDTAGELNDYKQRGDKRAMFIDERGSSIDYISHFRLVEKRKLDPFGKAFVVEDDDFNCVINLNELKGAIEGIPTLQTIKPKQLEYALKVLNIDEHSVITFKMFAVMAALSERMCTMDSFSQHLIDISDLMDIQRKMELYKAMFYCNVNSERSDNHITAESLHIELRAGGLNRAQEQYIMSLMKPDEYSDISFIDYMAYIPLFLSMHENIIDNPLDMAEKYNQKTDSIQQRDMNPLGLPLRREFIDAATSTTERKVPSNSIRTFIDKGDLLRREASSTTSLPRIPSARKGSSQWSPASRLSQR